MNTNKPNWQSEDKLKSVREYAEWLNDNARTMFLSDHAHMEILFLLSDDGSASTVAVPVEQDRDQIFASVAEQVKQEELFAAIQIVQRPVIVPNVADQGPLESVLVYAQTRDGSSWMLVNLVVETETELLLEPAITVESPQDALLPRFF